MRQELQKRQVAVKMRILLNRNVTEIYVNCGSRNANRNYHLLTTYRPPTDQLPITYRPLTDHLPTTYRSLTDYIRTAFFTVVLISSSLVNHVLRCKQKQGSD